MQPDVTYGVLFLGLPVIGIAVYVHLCRRMRAEAFGEPPFISLFTIFAAYGAILLFGVSEFFHKWSALHSITFAALLFVGIPWMLVQGWKLTRPPVRTPYHRSLAVLSFGFPLVLGGLIALTR